MNDAHYLRSSAAPFMLPRYAKFFSCAVISTGGTGACIGSYPRLVLGSLHDEMDKSSAYFSNEMPRSISTKPDYSLRYWRDHELWPKKRAVFKLLSERARLRLKAEVPRIQGFVRLGDARRSGVMFRDFNGTVRGVITPPPYLDITRYEEDQWLGRWFLGGAPGPTYGRISKDDRHSSKRIYWRFLSEVWAGIQPLIAPGATLVCRIGAKGLAWQEIEAGLITSLKDADLVPKTVRPARITTSRKRQTEYFLPRTHGCLYELDVTFRILDQ